MFVITAGQKMSKATGGSHPLHLMDSMEFPLAKELNGAAMARRCTWRIPNAAMGSSIFTGKRWEVPKLGGYPNHWQVYGFFSNPTKKIKQVDDWG